VAILLIRPAGEVPLVAGDGVLVRFNAALVVRVNGGAEQFIVLRESRGGLFPAERKVSGGDDLDEVHEVEGLLRGGLFGGVEWVDVVVSPAAWAGIRVLLLHVCNNGLAQLGAEAQVVDFVGEGVGLVLEVIL